MLKIKKNNKWVFIEEQDWIYSITKVKFVDFSYNIIILYIFADKIYVFLNASQINTNTIYYVNV